MFKILIADDEELELKSMHIFFQRNYPEAEVMAARDGTKVVELTLEHQPDLLILDIEMPGLNGLKALRLLRNEEFEGHVIIKTAYSRFIYAQEAVQLKVDAYLLKPVKKVELKKILDEIFRSIDGQRNARKGNKNGFGSGFIVSVIFPKERCDQMSLSDDFAKFQKEVSQRLALLCDFALCSPEENVFPILVYLSEVMDEYVYTQLSTDILRILNEMFEQLMDYKPDIRFGCLITDLYGQLPKTYYSSYTKLNVNTEQKNENQLSIHLNRALSYINEHYSEDISLENTAVYVNINASYLSHLFKKELQKSFVEYITDLRMSKAIEMIEQGIDNVKVLSEKVGYQYSSYFCKLFKRYTGYTVSEYKRRIKNRKTK